MEVSTLQVGKVVKKPLVDLIAEHIHLSDTCSWYICTLGKELQEAEAEIKRLKTLVKMAICPNCDGSGAIPHQVSGRQYVTREMALDAGDPALEGSLYSENQWEAEQCQWCYEKEQALKGE